MKQTTTIKNNFHNFTATLLALTGKFGGVFNRKSVEEQQSHFCRPVAIARQHRMVVLSTQSHAVYQDCD